MKKSLKYMVLTLSLCAASSMGHADSSVETLSPDLRVLLGKEMLALQEGMKSIIPAYTSGNLEEVAHIAEKMKNSFILKQNITSEQKHELKSKMPRYFLHLDQKFHEDAGMLEHVAKEKHTELVGFYYYKLTESCVSCHSHFANHKFPKLRVNTTKKDNHH
jgi:cytochrome c556